MQNEGGGDSEGGENEDNNDQGNDQNTSQQQGASLTEESGFLSAGSFPIKFTYTKLENDDNWDIKMVVQMDSKDVFYFKAHEDYLSGARVGEREDGTLASGYVYSIFNDGIIRFENRLFPTPGSEFSGTKHIRLLVEGDLNPDTLVLEKVERYEGASAELAGETQGYFGTINGSDTTGFRVLGYACNSEILVAKGNPDGKCYKFENWKKSVDACIEGGDCTSEAAIAIDTSNFEFVFPGEDISIYTLMGEYLTEVELPLIYGSVTLEDIPIKVREDKKTPERESRYSCKRDISVKDENGQVNQVLGAACKGLFDAPDIATAGKVCNSAKSVTIEGTDLKGKGCCWKSSSWEGFSKLWVQSLDKAESLDLECGVTD